MLTLRRVKGDALTHNELDDNFEYLDNRINNKANATHTHGIGEITGLQDALDNKIDEGNVNVPNGLLQLGADGKVACEFLKDCFGVADKANTADLIENGKIKSSLLPDSSCDCVQINADIDALEAAMPTKVSHDTLFDSNGKVKAELLPDDGCDCQQMLIDIQNLQSQKANRLKVYRTLVGAVELQPTDDVLIFGGNATLNLDGQSDGMSVKLRRMNQNDMIEFNNMVSFVNGQSGTWDNLLPNTIEILFADNQWIQIG